MPARHRSPPPKLPVRAHIVGQWFCVKDGLACTNVGSLGLHHAYIEFADDGSETMLHYREDNVVNNSLLPHIREVIDTLGLHEFFLFNRSSKRSTTHLIHLPAL